MKKYIKQKSATDKSGRS